MSHPGQKHCQFNVGVAAAQIKADGTKKPKATRTRTWGRSAWLGLGLGSLGGTENMRSFMLRSETGIIFLLQDHEMSCPFLEV